MIPNSDQNTIKIYGGQHTIFEFDIQANNISEQKCEQIVYDNFKSVPVFHCGSAVFAGED